MCKYNKLFVFYTILGIALWTGEVRCASVSRRSQRQEVAPYPSAEELKPEIPFEEGVDAAPDQTYGPPDQTYGPPDQTYGPPDNTVEQLPSADEPLDFVPDPDAEEVQPTDPAPARFIARGGRSGQQQSRRPAVLTQRQRLARPQRLVLITDSEDVAAPASLGYLQPLRLISPAQAAQLQLQLW